MNWVELSVFTSTEGVDILCGILLGMGVNGFVIKDSKDFEEFLENKEMNWDYIDDDLMGLKNCETTVTVYLPDNSQGVENFNAIKSELSALKSRDAENKFGRLEYEISNVKEEDWANNWKQYFKPITIGNKIIVKPSWEKVSESEAESRKILEIDPASSFGTGQHNTTQLCLELIEKYISEGDKMLDLGCGSGILSIGGILLGAKSAFAVDIEENAVKIAKENAEKNGIPDDVFKAECGNVICDENLRNEIGTGYDFLCANIVADVLRAMTPYFKGFLSDNGTLVVSGIIDSRKDEVINGIVEQGFRLLEVAEKEDWVAAAFKA